MAEGLGQGASCLGGLAFFSRGDEYQAEEAAWDLLSSTHYLLFIWTQQHHNTTKISSQVGKRRLLRKLWECQGGSGSASRESTHSGTNDGIYALEKK
mmetsp:Transcript_4602/g.8192  ORF Transcript_4602/g.8192 Transcript_4602/m.8192 type:complete len:97 (-) Transcript_4602:81-371(-)